MVNRHAIPRLLVLNGWPTDRLPTLAHAEIQAPDLGVLSDYVLKLSQAGAPLFPDGGLLAALMEKAKLPIPVDPMDADPSESDDPLVAKRRRGSGRGQDTLWGAVEGLEAEIRKLTPRAGAWQEPTGRAPVLRLEASAEGDVPTAYELALKRAAAAPTTAEAAATLGLPVKTRKRVIRNAEGRVTAVVEEELVEGVVKRIVRNVEWDDRGRLAALVDVAEAAPQGGVAERGTA